MGCRSRFATHTFVLLGFLILFGASVARAQLQPRVTQAIDNHLRVTLAGNVHPLARAEFDRGTAGNSQPMTRMLLLLKRSDAQQAALSSFMEQQQDKSSPNYHAWLSPQNFGAQYGPDDADIQAVSGWLASQGFTVNKVYSGKSIIEFSGNAGQVQQAFNTEIRKYEVLGKLYTANAQDPQIPAALAPVISGIVSLNSFPRTSHARYLGVARRVAGKSGLQPLFTFPRPNGNGNFYGLGPGDFATIYNSQNLISGGNDGSNQTIAVVGETNINAQDVISFRSIFGLPTNFSASNIILNGEDPGITSIDEETEADLDVEWSGATAPGANVKFVVSASTPASQGIDLSALYIIEHNLAGVMSESYGFCEQNLGTAGNAFYNSLWEQAAAQGITAVVSSGDGGTAGCDDFNAQSAATGGLAVSGLSGTPYNVSVGGTDFDQRLNPTLYWKLTNNATTGTSAIGYIPEIPWNESCAQIGLTGCGASAPNGSMNIVAGSGGQSTCANQTASGACISGYPKPSWQMGVTGNDNHRDQPDISLFASPGFDGSGYIICQSDHTISGSQTCDLTNAPGGSLDFDIVGGTSASAPAFAGVMALVNQYQGAHGGSNRQGNANYVLYQLAKKTGASCTSSASEASTCIFNDIVKGNSDLLGGIVGVGTNSVPCQPRSTNCSAVTGTNNGVLVDPAHPTAEAWTVAPGYDMVTGLGTVNIGNLATKWSTVSTVATTTTLTLTPQTGITHGTAENVTVNITVKPTSGTGTATGDVSLIATISGGTQGLDQFTLANGAVSNQKTQSLPGGTNYQVVAHYAGDGTNAPSDSNIVVVTVTKENSQTFIEIPTFDGSGNPISVNASSVPYGSQFYIRMYAANTTATLDANGFPSPFCANVNIVTCPSGTIVLTDNGSPVDQGTFNLNNAGYTRDLTPSFSTFTGGTHNLKAAYSGDNSFNMSIGTNTITITPIATQIMSPMLSPNAAYVPQLIGTPITLTTSVTPYFGDGVAPTGTITFYDAGVPISGTVILTSHGGTFNGRPSDISGSLTTTFLTSGIHVLTAKYSGDNSYVGVTSQETDAMIVYPTSMSQSESAQTINFGQSITLSATVVSNRKGPAMTGKVQFTGANGTFNGVTSTPGTDASGNQILTTTATTVPQISGYISASYSGDANYAGAQTNGDLVTVIIPDFSVPSNVTISATAGQTGTGTLLVTPLSNTPSTVVLTIAGVVPAGTNLTLTPSSVSLNGSAVQVAIKLTTTGTNGVQSNLRSLHSAGGVSLSRPTWWSLTFVCLMIALYLTGSRGRRRSLRAALFMFVIGLVSFALGCGGGGGSGGGGGGGGGGVGPFATTTTVSTSAVKVAQGTPITFTATVSGQGTQTGTVDFYLDGSWFGVGTLAAGTATLTTPVNSAGTYSLTAKYGGDAKNLASTSAALPQVVTGSAVVTISGQTGSQFHSTNLTITLQ